MKAVVIEKYGGADVLEIKDIPMPVVGDQSACVSITYLFILFIGFFEHMPLALPAEGGVTGYHHDKSGKLLSETDSAGNRIADYVYVNGNMAAKVESSGVSYYHTDPAGTPVAITDSTGALVWRAEYLPFGEEQLLVNTKVNDKMFVGKEKDEETGLYYFGARYMQDRNARFVSVDPVGPVDPASNKTYEKMLLNPQKLNRYA